MVVQPGLFDAQESRHTRWSRDEPAPARVRVPERLPHSGGSTSKAAARAKASTAAEQRLRVLAAIRQRGDYGATADELEVVLGMLGNSIRPRLVELRGECRRRPDLPVLIQDSGEHRPTRSGRSAVVWKPKTLGGTNGSR